MEVLVVGAGLTGCTVAEQLAAGGINVLLIDRKAQIGGLCADGGGVRWYGPHIFHTTNRVVWDYVRRFADFSDYVHRVVAKTDYGLLPFPPNSESLRAIGDADVMDVFYKGYTAKQWGPYAYSMFALACSRVPVRDSGDDQYFPGEMQGIPVSGYSEMCRRMTASDLIEFCPETEYAGWHGPVVWTGRVDEFHGERLPYRSATFTYRCASLPGPVVNYPGNEDYTREVDYRQLCGKVDIVGREVPCEFVPGENEPLYPVPFPSPCRRWQEYKDALPDNLLPCGRLGDYSYMNMDAVVVRAMGVAQAYLIPCDE